MKIDLPELWNNLKLPVGALAVFSALLYFIGGTPIADILKVIEGLVGVSALVFVLLDVLKYVGALPDGYAGVISSGIHLALILTVAAVLKLYPSFDFASADAQIGEFAKVAGLVIAYIIQVFGTKQIRAAALQGLGIGYAFPKG